MRIVIDSDIPFIQGVFEPFAEVVYKKGGEIDRATVQGADALIIRTRTQCNRELLEGSTVKMIASATIGQDHADLAYCREKGIVFTNAAGCNAGGVMQYVFTALYALAQKKGMELPRYNHRKQVLGVIGVGNVGSKVAGLGEYLGFEVLRNDPPKEREQTDGLTDYYSLEYLLEQADVVSVHVYLDDKTRNMINDEFLARMKPGALLINTSRGEVADEEAILRHRSRLGGVILDVWDHEPGINRELLACTDIATPHIAGYSYEGKLNGTQMVVRSVAGFFNLEPLKSFVIQPETVNLNHLDLKNWIQPKICEVLNNIFPIFEEDGKLRNSPSDFEKIRSAYQYRREFYVKSE